jgi:hypothetical protein
LVFALGKLYIRRFPNFHGSTLFTTRVAKRSGINQNLHTIPLQNFGEICYLLQSNLLKKAFTKVQNEVLKVARMEIGIWCCVPRCLLNSSPSTHLYDDRNHQQVNYHCCKNCKIFFTQSGSIESSSFAISSQTRFCACFPSSSVTQLGTWLLESYVNMRFTGCRESDAYSLISQAPR